LTTAFAALIGILVSKATLAYEIISGIRAKKEPKGR
jgi:hypothetical protein